MSSARTLQAMTWRHCGMTPLSASGTGETSVTSPSWAIRLGCAPPSAVSYLLHPPKLSSEGLLAALHAYLEGLARQRGIAVEVDFPARLDPLSRGAGVGELSRRWQSPDTASCRRQQTVSPRSRNPRHLKRATRQHARCLR